MPTSIRASLVAGACVCLLVSACGGGGGGGGGGGSGNNGNGGVGSGNPVLNEPTATIDTRNFQVSVSAWDTGQLRTATLTVANMPQDGAWVAIENTSSGIVYADLVPQNQTTAAIYIQFQAGAQLPPGTYADTVTVSVCGDEQCATQFRNSPIVLSTTLVVTGQSSISPDAGTVAVTASKRTPGAGTPTGSVSATIGSPGPNAPHVELVATSPLVQGLTATLLAPDRLRFDIGFRSPASMQVGDHEESLLVRACYDSSCAKQLTGSPFSIPVSYRVTNDAPTEPGIAPLEFVSRIALPHDVVDSEFSKALGAIVMVSGTPRNSLYLFDVATQTEREFALPKRPFSVSIAPDGATAAVGHDALVSVVDLAALALGSPAPAVLLDSSTVAFDTVIDGRGFVHLFPESDQWVNVHSVEIATNTETLSTGRTIYDSARARLHPSGDFIYSANNGLSPSDIEKFDITGGVASYLRDSPYHGDYGMCGDLWLKEDGMAIYTRCGNTFRSSVDAAQDMIYSGRLELSVSPHFGYAIESLSHSSVADEIVLIEADTYTCSENIFTDPVDCYMHLATYESEFLNRLSVQAITPISVAGTAYAQRGLFVFHGADGANKYMISRLSGVPDPSAEYYLTVLE